ncbi:hypothetical protein CPT_Moabite_242 [Serratia phage Moabite]|uniref:Uncharacterized protein n=1 Tax=Serratia phage Moabite TaxID=2587814 RepID=A0A4Y5TPM3_9CAUD|nr:hypothetical protein HWC48_gp174 [Serratia phage Moabite]QDB71272.1 hypothetical protein CPT_Moabite_242 [Serratia phage Moabite]
MKLTIKPLVVGKIVGVVNPTPTYLTSILPF